MVNWTIGKVYILVAQNLGSCVWQACSTLATALVSVTMEIQPTYMSSIHMFIGFCYCIVIPINKICWSSSQQSCDLHVFSRFFNLPDGQRNPLSQQLRNCNVVSALPPLSPAKCKAVKKIIVTSKYNETHQELTKRLNWIIRLTIMNGS